MNKQNEIFIFDMDGVIVNTIESLYSVYLEFLNEFYIKGTKEEFALLNGPKIEQIVSYLKQKYNLQANKFDLIELYDEKIKKIYLDVKLIKGARSVLETLKKRNFKIALASSSKRNNIEVVLARLNLRTFFDFIVSGDEVKEAKPSPEIYNIIKNRFKNHEYYVIEDSEQGIESAKAANMQVIFFNPKKKNILKEEDYTISEMKEVHRILEEMKLNCKTVALSNEIEVRLTKEYLDITPAQENVVNQIWDEEKKKNKSLFNGKIISYCSHSFKNNKLYIECFMTDYKYFLAQLSNKKLDLNIAPLAVSGIIIDKNHKTLVGKRSDECTEYKGFYEFVPSGGINDSNINGSDVLFIEQLKQELYEEANIRSNSINMIVPLCLVFDKKNHVYDICSAIHLKDSLSQIGNNSEYKDLQILELSYIPVILKKAGFLPTSKVIYEILQHTK